MPQSPLINLLARSVSARCIFILSALGQKSERVYRPTPIQPAAKVIIPRVLISGVGGGCVQFSCWSSSHHIHFGQSESEHDGDGESLRVCEVNQQQANGRSLSHSANTHLYFCARPRA